MTGDNVLINPALAAFLESTESDKACGVKPVMHRLTPARARQEYDDAARALDAPGPAVESIVAISIPGRDGQLIDARLYTPASLCGIVGLLPVLLYFHGGGYCVGGFDSHDSICRSLAVLTPCCVLHVAYRLAPEHRFPAAVNDVQDAYLWVLSRGAAFALDAARLAVGGDCAGGTLAAGLAITARNRGWPPPVGQVLLYPCTGARQNTDSYRRFARGYWLEIETLQWMYANYLSSEQERFDWRFALLQTKDLSNLPPALIVLAEYDPLIDEGISYAARLQAAGVTTLLNIYPGMVHDFARLGGIVDEAQRVRKDIARALADVFYSH